MCKRLEVDTLTRLLDGPRAQRAFVLQSHLARPWCLRIEDHAPLTLLAAVNCATYVSFDDGESARIEPGGVALVRGPSPYLFSDAIGSTVQAIVGVGQNCVTVNGSALRVLPALGVRAWGSGEDASDVVITGTYERANDVSTRLLDALPRIAIVTPEQLGRPLLTLPSSEVKVDAIGQEAVLDRLLDLLLIAALRCWFASNHAVGWAAAWADPVVGKAIRLMQNDLALPWSVGSLANATTVSRATFARRFAELVGEPPMTFLRKERMRLAADLLRSGSSTLNSVASSVGYANAFALSAAFSRDRGISPSRFRRGEKVQ